MIDRAKVTISSGKGGDGSISGRREKYVPHGGPDGGDGGKGGSVYVVGDENLNTLQPFRYKRTFNAGDGGHGEAKKRHGAKGRDLRIQVPVGTEVWADGTFPRLVADLATDGEQVMIAKGGRGGRGNTRFATPVNQFPRLAEAGEVGEGVTLLLELKLLGDIGIVGAPNAGKSSLLAAVSAARPKVADYPFTTIEPALGVVEHKGESFVMVDIPGLIEGAHSGSGLGDEFLRHVERTRVLVHLVDGTLEDLVEEYRKVRRELEMWDEALVKKHQIIAVNKADVDGVVDRFETARSSLESEADRVICISAAGRTGLPDLLDGAMGLLAQAREDEAALAEEGTAPEDVPVVRPGRTRRRSLVSKRGDEFVVSSKAATRLAAMVNESDWAARMEFYGHLERLGVIKELEQAGVRSGDVVKIGVLEWEWE